jgi:hypothetical protein
MVMLPSEDKAELLVTHQECFVAVVFWIPICYSLLPLNQAVQDCLLSPGINLLEEIAAVVMLANSLF